MRSFVLITALVLGLGGSLAAQPDMRQELKRLALSEPQMQQVVEVVRSTLPEIEKARAESRVVQAELARLLLDDNPAKAEIEKLVRQGLDWDAKVKLLRIDRSLKIRAIVGKDHWAGLSDLSRRVFEAEKAGKRPMMAKDDDKPALKNLLKVLRDLN